MATGDAGTKAAQVPADDEPPSGILARISTAVFGRVGSAEQSAANRGWILVTSATTIGGIVLIALLATSPRSFASGCLIALAAAMTGSLAGFLFGLPRSRTDLVTHDPNAAGRGGRQVSVESRSASGYRANTNLEDISDWLTKIFVGLGLTQIGSIPGGFRDLVNTVKVAMGSGDDAAAIAGSLIVGYVILGFLGTYLWARTRLSQALRLGDSDPSVRLDAMEEQLSDLRTTVASGGKS